MESFVRTHRYRRAFELGTARYRSENYRVGQVVFGMMRIEYLRGRTSCLAFLQTRACQLQPTGGPHISLTPSPERRACVYIYRRGGGGLNSPELRYLQSTSYAKSTAE